MTRMANQDDFFMEDERVEDVVRAFEEGQKHYTAPRHPRGRTMYLDATAHEVSEPASTPFGAVVAH